MCSIRSKLGCTVHPEQESSFFVGVKLSKLVMVYMFLIHLPTNETHRDRSF